MSILSVLLLLLPTASAWVAGGLAPRHAPRLAACTVRATEGAAPAAMPADYEAAESRGFELYQTGEFERAIRMFELAQTLPGAGIDYVRETQSGMIGSAGAPPNPRGMKLSRYATTQQKLIAQYNIACCCAGMGDTARAIEMVRTYLGQVVEPMDSVNEMLVDDDLMPIREGLRALREEFKGKESTGGLFAPLNKLNDSMRAAAENIGVEWK